MWICCIETGKPIMLIKVKLLINNGVVELVQLFVLCYFFPHAVTVIVIGNSILMLPLPQEMFQNQKRVSM